MKEEAENLSENLRLITLDKTNASSKLTLPGHLHAAGSRMGFSVNLMKGGEYRIQKSIFKERVCNHYE